MTEEKPVSTRRKATRRMSDRMQGLVTEEERRAYDAVLCSLKMITDRRAADRRSGADKPAAAD